MNLSDPRSPIGAMPEEHLKAIAECLAQAFKNAQTAKPKVVTTGNEESVTELIEEHLNHLIQKDEFLRDLVSAVARGAERKNYNEEKIKLRPDLSIYLTARNRFSHPLIVEAKIIDHQRDKTVKLYCDKGVRRFQTGDYAWQCREAMMLAYVRDGSKIEMVLTPHINLMNTSGVAEFGTISGPSIYVAAIGERALSEHNRSFRYSSQSPPHQDPGPITLWHIWLPSSTVNHVSD